MNSHSPRGNIGFGLFLVAFGDLLFWGINLRSKSELPKVTPRREHSFSLILSPTFYFRGEQ